MSRLRVLSFGVSLDGYSAGPDQSLENPLGVMGPEIFEWFFPTHVFQAMHGGGRGETGIDNRMAEESFENIGAWILGRNMFGPVRGPWPDESWKVLTHHARKPISMKGGTTFHFVTGGIESALKLAKEAAGGKDIRVGGGVATVRQYLSAGLIDDLHLAVRPVLLGRGENLFQGLDLRSLGYACERSVTGERATHVFVRKR
jgi:dihydrofolate reductase